jgi:hypothetical protein
MSESRQNALVIKYDIDDIKKNSKLFLNKFHVLTIVKPDEKLLVSDKNILQLDNTYKPIQFAVRWFYSQGREVLQPYFVEHFNDYIDFLDLIKLAKNSERLTTLEKNEVVDVFEEHKGFIKQLDHGFDYLIEMYGDYEPLVDSVKNIKSSLKLRLVN